MKYRVVSIIGDNRSVIAEVCSKEWAETFAEDVREWERNNGVHSLFKIVVEEIK